jgi:large subunit ribosomal protein L10
MPRPEKVQAVAEIKERLEESPAVFVAEYAGLSVKEQQELRRGLRAADSEFKVVKMTLARLAASELGHDDLVELLIGPTGLTFASGDAAVTAKVLNDFAKEHAQLVLKGALLAGELLPPERVAELAELEPREVLLARVAGMLQAPMTKAAGLMAAMPRNLATMLQQLIDKLPAEAPAEESAPAEEPAEEAASEVEETAEETPADESAEDAEDEAQPEAAADEETAEPDGEADEEGAEPEGEAEEAEEA